MLRRLSAFTLCISQAACSTIPAHFDVPYSNTGVPLANSVVQRIRCELAELVQDEALPLYNRRATLLEYDYYASMLLSLDANDTGSLTPSLTFPHSGFSFNVTPSLKLSRQDQINYSLRYSMREIYDQWKQDKRRFACPDPDTNLAGNLGIREKVSSALNLSDLAYTTSAKPSEGVFSGIINFTATKSINQIGPTWTLTHFSGPGAFISASEVNTDKLSFGFAGGTNANKPFKRLPGIAPIQSAIADEALQRALTNDLGTQLNAIRNTLR
ncbi:hypothetical protein [uncultured Methylobacterium sp.]|uniref:hypothetical protein n=1 Tax=uncultured Methylobacterium sp. TaxID=157278 RepID=UPI00259512A9|nr:hypothetical protein [uncultured Methylobacterium sp.]